MGPAAASAISTGRSIVKVMFIRGLVAMTILAGTAATAAEALLAGSYSTVTPPAMTLNLSVTADGGVQGTVADGTVSLPLSGRRSAGGFTGTVGVAGAVLPVTGRLAGENLDLEMGTPGSTQRFMFRRAGGAPPPAAAQGNSSRQVIINNVPLTDARIAELERTYSIRIGDADYWYDAVLGAWGVKGSPVLGFISPSLPLPGPMPADASGRGASGIFINGRELHPQDVTALQRITGTVVPGRYFLTAAGIAGYEGGPPQWNLAALVAQAGGNPSNSWQTRLGASGFSDGTTGAVFLPNGGIVSTGQ